MSDRLPGRIRLRGVRQNNLKIDRLDLPLRKLIVFAGLSGSGKSSLAFETLFAEGQRRYIETFSPYARQFLDRMDKPQATRIEGIPPAIAIEQRNSVKSTRSTVGTMTEITDYAKTIWPHIAELHCRNCGKLVRKDAPADIWDALLKSAPDSPVTITFDLALSGKFSPEEIAALIQKQGYQKVLLDGQVTPVEEAMKELSAGARKTITVVQDRVTLTAKSRPRFVEACEQAYHFGRGRLAIRQENGTVTPFSNRMHCAECDIEYPDPSPAMFSFNHPIGACPACKGFGRIITIDYMAAIPDDSKTLAGGAVKPWQTPSNAECQVELLKFARKQGVPVDVPFRKLTAKQRAWVVDGDPDHNKDKAHQWPHSWYGVKGYFRWLESRAYKMHVRVLLSRYRAYETCPECHGARLKPDGLLYQFAGRTLAEFYALAVSDALRFVDAVCQSSSETELAKPLRTALEEIRARLAYLEDVGLGYLSLDRATRTLSGGETSRVNLATCLGSRLCNTLFVLDEPTVGLHARDTGRLVRILRQLRDAGNTVVVVEHESQVIRAADEVVELGPGQGESGGRVVFHGPCADLVKDRVSLTGAYLSHRRTMPPAPRRPVSAEECACLKLRGATLHNLHAVSVDIPLGRMVAVTGVSGSGKTTLARKILAPALLAKLRDGADNANSAAEDDDHEPGDATHATGLSIEGWEALGGVVIVDQSPLGRTPRSNPAVYAGAFDEIRTLFADSDSARQAGLNESSFSFNSPQGQCERCRGAGFEKIEMQFLSDIFIRCAECKGRRYREHVLAATLPAPGQAAGQAGWNIADLLEATIDDSLKFLAQFPDSRPAQRAAGKLRLLSELGLGYLRLGQPLNTLSGGESQRLKLVKHLAQSADQPKGDAAKPSLFLFDEPTSGLHFDDIRVLLKTFQRLVDEGNSVIVIEHNLDVIWASDWVIDLGPEGGVNGGKVTAEGKPETILDLKGNQTGVALKNEGFASPAKSFASAS